MLRLGRPSKSTTDLRGTWRTERAHRTSVMRAARRAISAPLRARRRPERAICATPVCLRLVGALLVEINDEMIAAERRYIAAASVATLLDNHTQLPSLPAAPRT